MIISGTYDVKHLETLEEKAFCGQAIDSQIIIHSKYFSVFSLFFFWIGWNLTTDLALIKFEKHMRYPKNDDVQ